MEYYVIDGKELEGWGPFNSIEEADAFIATDKYLASWCDVIEKNRVRKHISLYPPSRYWE